MATETLNRTQLADLFDKDPKTIDAWVRSGCPYVQRGSHGVQWKFSVAEVANWRVADATARAMDQVETPDMADLEWRHEYAKTLLAELKLAKEKGEVAYIDEFAFLVGQTFIEIRSRFRDLPKRMAGQLAVEKQPEEIRNHMLSEIDLILNELAEFKIKLPDGEYYDPEA